MQNRIGVLRRAKALSQAELADRVGTTRSQINRLEHGDRRLSQVWMERIAQALEVKPSDLLPGAETDDLPGAPESEILKIVSRLPEADKHLLVRIARSVLRRWEDADIDSETAPPSKRQGKRG